MAAWLLIAQMSAGYQKPSKKSAKKRDFGPFFKAPKIFVQEEGGV